MSALFAKKSLIDKRIRRLQKEIESVNDNINHLSKSAGSKTAGYKEPPQSTGAAGGDEEEIIKKRAEKIMDERFADYLSTSFRSLEPLRHERKIMRNRSVVMTFFVLILVFWIIYRFLVM